jgi:hypothetical protein
VELNPLMAKLAAKRRELAGLDQKRTILAAQIEAYEDALRLLNGTVGVAEGGAAPDKPTPPRQRTSKRQLSKTWGKILDNLGGRDFDYDEIMACSDLLELGVQRNVARSQMNNYLRAGIVETRPGKKFRVTDAGVAAAKSALETEGAPEVTDNHQGSPETGDQ